MQRVVSKAAIRAGKKNNLPEFFTKIREITKYKDQHGVPSDHQEQLKEIIERIKNSPALTGEEICQIAMLTAYLFQNTEESNQLISKAQQKEPNNEFIFKEAVFLTHYDFREDEAKTMFDQKKGSLKDATIKNELEKFFKIKAESNAQRDAIVPLFGEEKWAEADAKIVAAIKAMGGLNPYNLDLYRMRMDSLRGQPNNQKNVGEFYMNLATQNPSSNGYYQYAGSTFLEANLNAQAITAYSNYFKYECNDIEELDKFLAIADKKTQIATLEGLLSNKIVQSDQKQDIINKLSALGGNTSLGANDSDEEENNKKVQQNNANLIAENNAYNASAAAHAAHAQSSSEGRQEQSEQPQQNKGMKSEKENVYKEQPASNSEMHQQQSKQQHVVIQEQQPIQRVEEQPQVQAPASNPVFIQQQQPVVAQQFGSENKQQEYPQQTNSTTPVVQQNDSACCTIF